MHDSIEEKCIKSKDKYEGEWWKLNGKTIGMTEQWINQYLYHLVSSKTLTTY